MCMAMHVLEWLASTTFVGWDSVYPLVGLVKGPYLMSHTDVLTLSPVRHILCHHLLEAAMPGGTACVPADGAGQGALPGEARLYKAMHVLQWLVQWPVQWLVPGKVRRARHSPNLRALWLTLQEAICMHALAPDLVWGMVALNAIAKPLWPVHAVLVTRVATCSGSLSSFCGVSVTHRRLTGLMFYCV